MIQPLIKLSDWVAAGKPPITNLNSVSSTLGVEARQIPQPKGAVTFIVYGAPRTKKTSNRLIPGKGKGKGRAKILPSAAWEKWVTKVALFPVKVSPQPDRPYSCRALFYRDKDAGDACGFYQGLADALAHWEILSNDKLIVDWDGSRMLKDAKRPRVEVTLTPVSA